MNTLPGAAVAMKKTLKSFLTGTPPKTPPARPRPASINKRAVWRISDHAPMGEWVDPDAVAAPGQAPNKPPQKPPREATSSGWIESSMDLLNGADVSEDHESSPGELFDDLNNKHRPPQRD
jgi:hypothetical protein